MNEFTIMSKLGEGAYSVVYKVKRLIDSNIYALKKVKLLNLSDKEKQNALNEVRILASLKSRNVISYKECFFEETDNFLGIVMEYADKGDLYQKICELKKLQISFEESDIWRILIQMVKGLKSLHDLKILHRDLKSANVFLFSDGTAKLGDLNVSKVAKKGLGYTQTGTPYYASPEVWRDKPYDLKSDIWSLGCVLYEMVMLKPPFRAEDMEGLYNKVIKGQFPKISDKFSHDLSEIVRLLIQVNPEHRPNCGKNKKLKIDQLLKNPIVMKKIEYFKTLNVVGEEEVKEENFLLQTIRIPKNLLYLTDKLPTSNYEKYNTEKRNQNQSFSNNRMNKNDILPDINGQQHRKVKANYKEIDGKSISPPRNKILKEEANFLDESSNLKESGKDNKILDGKIKKLAMPKLNYNSIENDHSKLLILENSNRSNDRKKNNIIVNNSINNDIMLLPQIRAKNEMSLSPSNRAQRSDKENIHADYNKKKEDSRNIVYNQKKILKLIQNASIDQNVNYDNGSYIPYVIHNRNNALLNKYNKYKVDKSHSPIGKQKYIKNHDYRQVGKSNKLPVIQNSRKINPMNIN